MQKQQKKKKKKCGKKEKKEREEEEREMQLKRRPRLRATQVDACLGPVSVSEVFFFFFLSSLMNRDSSLGFFFSFSFFSGFCFVFFFFLSSLMNRYSSLGFVSYFSCKSSLRDSISMYMPHRKCATSDVNNP